MHVQVSLAEKVDLVLAEIVGSVASEEGLYATIRDAQARRALCHVDATWMRRPGDRTCDATCKATGAIRVVAGESHSKRECHVTGDRAAQARHLKRPYDASSYIPAGCQTLAAPASYALHYALGPPQESAPPAKDTYCAAPHHSSSIVTSLLVLPPQYDWTKLGEPVRLNCRDETLQLLDEPQAISAPRDTDLNSVRYRSRPREIQISARDLRRRCA